MKDFELRRSRGDLLLTKTSSRLDLAMQRVPHSYNADGNIYFGDSIVVLHEFGALACDKWDKMNPAGDAVSSVNKNTSPVARNTFVITKPSKYVESLNGAVKYGDPFCLASNPSLSVCERTGFVKRPMFLSSDLKTTMRQAKLSMKQEVFMSPKESYHAQWIVQHINPTKRLKVEGLPVPANEPFLLIHKATNTPLACESHYTYRSDFGMEYEVFCEGFTGLRKVNGLTAEKLGLRGADMVEAPSEKPNFFSFKTADNADAAVDNRGLKEMTPEVVLELVKSLLLDRGVSGIRGLSRVFKLLDDRGLGKVSHDDFRYGMIEYGIHLSGDELDLIVEHFDKNKDGFIEFEELLSAFRGPPNSFREELIRAAYNKLDVDGSGEVTLLDIERTFKCAMHPSVISGMKTEREIAVDFIAGI